MGAKGRWEKGEERKAKGEKLSVKARNCETMKQETLKLALRLRSVHVKHQTRNNNLQMKNFSRRIEINIEIGQAF